MRNIFLETLCTKCGGEFIPRPFFWKIKIEHISESIGNNLKFYIACFYCMVSSGVSKYTETRLQTTCFHFILSYFKKIKRGLELIWLPHFLHNFWRRIFFSLYSINTPNFIVLLPLFSEILSNMCIAIVCKPVCDVMNFEVNLIFLRMERAFNMK